MGIGDFEERGEVRPFAWYKHESPLAQMRTEMEFQA